MDEFQSYVSYFQQQFKSIEEVITPEIIGVVRKELTLLANGYDFITTRHALEQARGKAEEQGYNPDTVEFVPVLAFEYEGEGKNKRPTSVSITAERKIYAKGKGNWGQTSTEQDTHNAQNPQDADFREVPTMEIEEAMANLLPMGKGK